MPTPFRLSVPRALAPGLFALALTALVAGPAAAQRTSGALAGRIQDAATGESLPYVSVAVWADSALVTGAMSGDDGAFRVEGVPAGVYDVVVSYVGFGTGRRATWTSA
jgi:hypothetical protein